MTITFQPTGIPDGNHTVTVHATIITQEKNENGQKHCLYFYRYG
jgi:hypothetical protein